MEDIFAPVSQEYIIDDLGDDQNQIGEHRIEVEDLGAADDHGQTFDFVTALGHREEQLEFKKQEQVDDQCPEFSLQGSDSLREPSTQAPSSPNPVQCHSDMQSEDKPKTLLDQCYKFLKSLAIFPDKYAKLSKQDKAAFQRFLNERLSKAGYQVALRQFGSVRNFKMLEFHVRAVDPKVRHDDSDKQVTSAAVNFIKEFVRAKYNLSSGAITKTKLERLVCKEYLGIPNASQALLDQIFGYSIGISKEFISAITYEGNFGLIKEVIRTIESGDACKMYEVKIREQLQRTLAGSNTPFMPVVKQRRKDGLKYETKPKVPVTLVEFKLHSEIALKTLKRRCKSLKIYEQVFGKPPAEPARSKTKKCSPQNPEDSLKKEVATSEDAATIEPPLKSQPRGSKQKMLQAETCAPSPNHEAEKSSVKVSKSRRAAKKESLASKVKELIKCKANKNNKAKPNTPKAEGDKTKRTASIVWKKTYRRVRNHNAAKGRRVRSQSL